MLTDLQDIQQSGQIRQNTKQDVTYTEPEFVFLPKKRTKRYTNHRISINELSVDVSEHEGDLVAKEAEFTTDDQNSDSSDYDIKSVNDEEYYEIFEDYSCPDFEPFQSSTTETTNDDRFSWILIWIMSFRVRFNFPETATESLLKFMKLVLEEIRNADFNSFPDTLYLTRKAFGLKDRFHSFVICSKCHKLYNNQEVKEFHQDETLAVMKCHHIEYPNSNCRRQRLCQVALSQQTKLLNGQISNRPVLIYPFAGIRQQLESMYCRPGFEALLRH